MLPGVQKSQRGLLLVSMSQSVSGTGLDGSPGQDSQASPVRASVIAHHPPEGAEERTHLRPTRREDGQVT